MRIRCAAWAVLLAGLLCLPGAALAAQEQGAIKATAVSWDSSNPELQGQLAVLFSSQPAGQRIDLADSSFEVHARNVHLEEDASDGYFETPALAGSVPRPAAHISTEVHDLADATVRGVASRPGRALYVFPLGAATLRVGVGCAEATPVPPHAAPAPLAAAENNPNIRSPPGDVNPYRPRLQADVSNTLELVPCKSRAVTLAGDFVVVLWEWDATIASPTAAFEVVTGRAGPATETEEGNLYYGGAHEAYLSVQNGTLTLRGDAAGAVQLNLWSASLHGVSRVEMHDAEGQVSGVGPVHAGSVVLNGRLDIDLLPDYPIINLNVAGLLQSGSVDGQPIQVASAVPAPLAPSGFPASLDLALLALLAAGVLAAGWLRRSRAAPREARAATSSESARRELAAGRVAAALRHATRAVRLEPHAASHRVLRAVVLVECARRTGRPGFLEEAVREEAKLNRDLPDPQDRAETRTEATELLCALGRREEALEALKLAAEEDRGVVVRRLLEGAYPTLRDEPWVRALLALGTADEPDPAFS